MMTARQEMLALHQARLKNGYKNLTIFEAQKAIVRADTKLILERMNERIT